MPVCAGSAMLWPMTEPPTARVPLGLSESGPRSSVGLVLDLDPDLGWGLSEEERDRARRACQGTLVRVPAGAWRLPASAGARDDILGFLIVGGFMCREIALRERHLFELLGPGDVLQPPVVGDGPRLSGPIGLSALRETLLIELGISFICAGARWPVLLARWARRLEVQRQHLAVQGLIAHLPRAEHRLLLMLWHLADRWGRVTPTGTALPVPLTHDLLGCLTAAQRSTATLAVSALEVEGAIQRLDDGSWLLTAAAERMVDEIALPGKRTHAIGESLMFRQRTADARAETRALRAEAEQARARHRESNARPRKSGPLIDALSGEIVEVERLSPRDRLGRGARRAAQAGEVAAKRAEQARERGQAAATRAAEIREGRSHSQDRGREAAERAVSAADAAKTAEASAAVALEHAAEAYERAARAHEHTAEVAERCGGDVEAPPHRRAASQAHTAARSARDAAVEVRRSFHTAPNGEFWSP
jgi:CRP/FNR family transcriptional regulator, cyclic AMP receptor protein